MSTRWSNAWRRSAVRVVGIFAVYVVLAGAALAAEGDPKRTPAIKQPPVAVTRVETPPVIDGKLDDDAWKRAAVLKGFVQVEPGDNTPPLAPTEVYLAYDEKKFYVAYHCHDDPSKVRATVARRETYFGSDDYVVFYLDTFDDKRRAYTFVLNAYGIQGDGIVTEGRGEDYSVDLVWESKGSIVEDGWVVEAAIPFKSLRYEAGEGKNWNAHFYRRIQHANRELDSWMPFDRNNSSNLGQAGALTGLVGIATEHNLEIIPSLTVSETGHRVSAAYVGQIANDPTLVDRGRFVNDPAVVDAGLNVKYGVTPAVTLDLAINPDFAQVEADATVITANQRFPIFFAEKRPFFLEGLDYFETPLRPVHTRTIVDPDVAAKVTGKRGPYTFGLLVASDNAPGNFSKEELADPYVRETNAEIIGKNSLVGVLRVKRDIGRENTIGALVTSYDFVGQHNKVAGVDGRFRLDESTVAEFQLLGTASRRSVYEPEADDVFYRSANGLGYYGRLARDTRHTSLELYGEGRTTNYFADVGFTERRNTNFNSVFYGYNSEPHQNRRLINWNVHNFAHIDYDFQGRIQIWEDESRVTWQFARSTSLSVAYEKAFERIFEFEFGPTRTATREGAFFGPDAERSTSKHHYFVTASTRPIKQISVSAQFVMRDGHFDFDFGAGPKFPRVSPAALEDPDAPLDPGPGRLWESYVSVAYNPTVALRTSLDYSKQRLRRYDTGLLAFDENIYSAKAIYQFSASTFARARLDYDSLFARARAQFLFGWTPTPGTAFYAGYNDDANLGFFNPYSGEPEPGFRRNGRTFFVKMSYLFRRSI
jgi:hypothetical protein